jgi:hypothetical protein
VSENWIVSSVSSVGKRRALSDRHPVRVQGVFSVADFKTHFRGGRCGLGCRLRIEGELRFLGLVGRRANWQDREVQQSPAAVVRT